VAGPAAAQDETILLSRAKVKHDFRVSLLILTIGIVYTVVWWDIFAAEGGTVQYYALGSVTFAYLIPALGEVLILVGTVFSVVNATLLWRPRAPR